MFFGDEMRLGLIGQVRRRWAPRGVKIRQPVEFTYKWAYLNLAVNPMEGSLKRNLEVGLDLGYESRVDRSRA